ncbi:hypothetical protein Esti_004851 [Eimeria stiedai]
MAVVVAFVDLRGGAACSLGLPAGFLPSSSASSPKVECTGFSLLLPATQTPSLASVLCGWAALGHLSDLPSARKAGAPLGAIVWLSTLCEREAPLSHTHITKMTSLFSKVTEQYGELVNFIIRPPRDSYSDDDLGPDLFNLELVNRRNMRLQCSHYEPVLPAGERRQLPCVIYLHGNCSSRVEALSALPVLLPHNITVFAFDFSGSGRSDGPYISLGWWERDDLDTVVEHLRSTGTVSSIGLWGRSMGAVTALMHAHRDPSIGGMVLDSPFAALRRLAEELADVVMQFSIPKFVLSILLGMVRNSIISKAQFDINHIAPINHVAEAYIPALFVYGKEDTFISPQHVKDLHEAYNGDKNLGLGFGGVQVEGGHNSPRPAFMLHSAAIFFRNTLNPLALSLGERGRRGRGSSTSERCIDSASSSSSELCSNASSGDLVIPLHPFADSDFSPAAAAVPDDTAAPAAATGVAGRRAAAGRCGAHPPVPQQQQQQQQNAFAAAGTAVSGQLLPSAACSPAAASGSSRRRPWRSSSSSKKEPDHEHACGKNETQSALHRRTSLLPRSFLRWGSSRSQVDSAAEAATAAPGAAANSSSSSRQQQQQHGRNTETPAAEASAQPAAAAATRAPAAAAAAAGAPPSDPVRRMAPPVPSFCFFNHNAGLEPLGFIEDEDEILQRAISISLEDFIREQQLAAEAAAREPEKTFPADA